MSNEINSLEELINLYKVLLKKDFFNLNIRFFTLEVNDPILEIQNACHLSLEKKGNQRMKT